MGNNDSKNKNLWNTVQTQNDMVPGSPSIVQNVTGCKGQLYQIELSKSQNIDQELQIYQRRKTSNSGHIVQIKDAIQKEQFFQCAGPKKSANVVTQYIPFRLVDHKNLSTQQSAYILDGSLSGFEQLKAHNKENFLISQRMIGADQNGKIKVWSNQNFGSNSLPQIKRNNLTQQNMINQLFNCVQQHSIPQGYENIKRHIPFEQMRSFPQAKFALKRFLTTIPNYNEVNIGNSLKPKKILNKNKIQNKINSLQNKQVIRSQIIKRQDFRPQQSSHSLNSFNNSSRQFQHIYQSKQKQNLQRSNVSRTNSSKSRILERRQIPIRQIPVAIKQQRVPLFIRQREEAKYQNKKQQEKKPFPILNSKPNYSPKQIKNNQNIKFNGQLLQKNIQISNKRKQNINYRPQGIQQIQKSQLINQKKNTVTSSNINNQMNKSDNVKSPLVIDHSPNVRPLNGLINNNPNFMNTQQVYRAPEVLINQQPQKRMIQNVGINIPAVNIKRNQQIKTIVQNKTVFQPKVQFQQQIQSQQYQNQNQIQQRFNKQFQANVNQHVYHQGYQHVNHGNLIQKNLQYQTVVLPQQQVKNIQVKNIQYQQSSEQKTQSIENQEKSKVNKFVNEPVLSLKVFQKGSQKVQSSQVIESNQSQAKITHIKRKKSSTFQEIHKQILQKRRSKQQMQNKGDNQIMSQNQIKAPNFLMQRQNSKKQSIKLDKPKRQFISKTTEINIIPGKKIQKEEEEQVFDQYGNRPLTGIQLQYQEQFIDGQKQRKQQQNYKSEENIDKEINVNNMQMYQQNGEEQQEINNVNNEQQYENRQVDLQVRGYNIYQRGINEEEKYENEVQYIQQQGQYDQEQYMRIKEQQMRLRMQIMKLQNQIQIQAKKKQQGQNAQEIDYENQNNFEQQQINQQQQVQRQNYVQYRQEIIQQNRPQVYIEECVENNQKIISNEGIQIQYDQNIPQNQQNKPIIENNYDLNNANIQINPIKDNTQKEYDSFYNSYSSLKGINNNNFNSSTNKYNISQTNINGYDFKPKSSNFSSLNNEYNYNFKQSNQIFKHNLDYSSKFNSSSNNSYTSFPSPPKSKQHTDFNALYAQFKPLQNQMNYGRSAESYSYSTQKKNSYNKDIISNKVYQYQSQKKIQTPIIQQHFQQAKYTGGQTIYTINAPQTNSQSKKLTAFLKTQKLYQEYNVQGNEDDQIQNQYQKQQVYKSSMQPFLDYTQVRK